jgi:hypothetical protein
MDEERSEGLEAALARTEAAAAEAQKAAQALVKAVRRYVTATQTGNLRDLGRAATAADQAGRLAHQQLRNAIESWNFKSEDYLASGAFARELIETGHRAGLRIDEQDDRLLSYPVLIRVQPGDQSVRIDKARERRLRPSVLVAHLKDMQGKPARFRSETFLESLFEAFEILAGPREGWPAQGKVIPLRRIYDVFTIKPGEKREYGLAEFTRDVYLLDRSGVTRTRDGWTIGFPASTATRQASQVLRLVTESGDEKKYYGLSFTRPE